MRSLKSKVLTIDGIPGEFRLTQLAAIPAARAFGAFLKYQAPLAKAAADPLEALAGLDTSALDALVAAFFPNVIYVHDNKHVRLDTESARDSYLTLPAVFQLITAMGELSFSDF
jgi:hypothetical protein